jgi:hypothetical protein
MEIIGNVKNIIKSNKEMLVIFVHGIAADHHDWYNTINLVSDSHCKMRFLNENEITHNYSNDNNSLIWTVSYYSPEVLKESFFGDLSIYALRLEKIIELIKKLTGKSKAVIIAHSMGGLVSRKYMTNSVSNWNSIHKILTIGTPNEGVITSIGIVGQLIDLKKDSHFLSGLNLSWNRLYDPNIKKWGVIGGIDKTFILNYFLKDSVKTDQAGPGYITISSAIPYNEWKDAVINIGNEEFNTTNFGFRIAVNADHRQLLIHEALFKGIKWTLEM